MSELKVEYITQENLEKFEVEELYPIYNALLKQLYPNIKGDFKAPSLHDGKKMAFLHDKDKKVIGLCTFYEQQSASQGEVLHIADFVVDRHIRSGGVGIEFLYKVVGDYKKKYGFEPDSLTSECAVGRERSQNFWMNKCEFQPEKFIFMRTPKEMML